MEIYPKRLTKKFLVNLEGRDYIKMVTYSLERNNEKDNDQTN